MAALGARSISAVFWGAGGTVLRLLIQISAQVVLARLLGPGEYGVFAIGGIVVGLCTFFADFGLAYGLIQKREINDADMRFAFTWQFVVGALVSVLIMLSSSALATFFDEPRAQPVVAALSVICLINALTGVPLSLLKRRLDVRTQQFGFIVSYALAFFGLGVPLALAGVGVWALVAAWIAQALLFLLIAYRAVRHPVRPLWWHGAARDQVVYSRTVVVTNVFNWAIANVDKVIVGHLLPSREIGLYATLFNLVYVPMASILGVVQPVFFSAGVRVAESDDEAASRAKLAAAFAALIAAVCLYILPPMLVAAALADKVVVTLYGAAWADGAMVLGPVCIAMPLFMAWGLSTPMLWASGQPKAEFGSQWHIGLLWVLACWGLASWGGIAAVAWGCVGLFGLRCLSTLHAVTRYAAISWRDLWRAARGGLLASLLAVAATGMARGVLDGVHAGPALHLAVGGIAGLAAYYLALRLMPRLVTPELANLMSAVLVRLPAGMRQRLAWLHGA